jgi:hypothetical protein
MLTLSVPDESYSRISSSALNYIFTCLLSQTCRRSVVFYVSIVTDLRQIGGFLRVYCHRLTADRWLFTCLLSQTYGRSVVFYVSIVTDLRQIGGFLRVYCYRLTADRWFFTCLLSQTYGRSVVFLVYFSFTIQYVAKSIATYNRIPI